MDDDPATFDEALETIDELRQRNQELLAQVMTLQGQSLQITDVEVAERFNKLHDAIRTWVQGYVQDLRQVGWAVHDFQRQLQSESGHAWLVKLLLRRADEPDHGVLSTSTTGIFDRADGEWATWLSRHSSCVHAILTMVLWDFLAVMIFSPPLPPGFHATEMESAVEDIMAVMSSSGVDGALARRWRAYTIDTLSKAAGLQEEKDKFLRKSVNGLAAKWPLTGLRGLSPSQGRSLEASVLSIAADLKKDMECSVFEYHLEEPVYERGEMPDRSRLERWRLQSVAQWIPVTSDDDVQGVFRCLYPAIKRTSADGREEIEILKPTVLVHDTSGPTAPAPGPRRRDHPLTDPQPEPGPGRLPLGRSYSDLPLSVSSRAATPSRAKYQDDLDEYRDRYQQRRKPVTETRPVGRAVSPRGLAGAVREFFNIPTQASVVMSGRTTELRQSSSPSKTRRRRILPESATPFPSQAAAGATTLRQQHWEDTVSCPDEFAAEVTRPLVDVTTAPYLENPVAHAKFSPV